jgi:hypothetical protein
MTALARSARFICAFAAFMLAASFPAAAQYESSRRTGTYSADEVVREGHKFFGVAARELAALVQRAGSQWGEPNGYILGEEGSGAIAAGLRYGEGKLYMKQGGDRKVFWQGPSLGFDFGGEGSRTMILVYNLPGPRAIFDRFGGVAGSAYLIGGFSMTALASNNVVLVPIKSGVGARLGVNLGYLKFTPNSTWNPF